MKTWSQYLDEQDKTINYGLKTGHSPGSLVKVVNPAKPGKLVYNGMNVNSILPVPRAGKLKSGIVGK